MLSEVHRIWGRGNPGRAHLEINPSALILKFHRLDSFTCCRLAFPQTLPFSSSQSSRTPFCVFLFGTVWRLFPHLPMLGAHLRTSKTSLNLWAKPSAFYLLWVELYAPKLMLKSCPLPVNGTLFDNRVFAGIIRRRWGH